MTGIESKTSLKGHTSFCVSAESVRLSAVQGREKELGGKQGERWVERRTGMGSEQVAEGFEVKDRSKAMRVGLNEGGKRGAQGEEISRGKWTEGKIHTSRGCCMPESMMAGCPSGNERNPCITPFPLPTFPCLPFPLCTLLPLYCRFRESDPIVPSIFFHSSTKVFQLPQTAPKSVISSYERRLRGRDQSSFQDDRSSIQ